MHPQRARVFGAVVVLVAALSAPQALLASAHERPDFRPGAPGVGDPYYPLYGNGGYDVRHYDLSVSYDPETDVLVGRAVILARATQDLSQFNLDLQGLTVRSVTVDGADVRWSRSQDHELTVLPSFGLRSGRMFTTVVRYDGVPRTQDLFGQQAGFMHTDDGAVVAGEPEVAANWFPVNDHPSDKASYSMHVTAPTGLTVVSNGWLLGTTSRGGQTTWNWVETAPMASYLATATIGQFRVHRYRADGRWMYDAVDPDLDVPFAVPRTGDQFVVSSQADSSYQRLARSFDVPVSGGNLSFWLTRATEQDWDFVFVEAHTVGQDDWTTLQDVNGHTDQSTGQSCPNGWQQIHPQLAHYQTVEADGSCSPHGSTGTWWAATGASDGPEQWQVDLGGWAGRSVEVVVAYASDQEVQGSGVAVDDVVVPFASGSTSFEDDGDTMDGWTVPGAPPGSPGNDGDFQIRVAADIESTGDIVDQALSDQPQILSFLSTQFGPYPFGAGGGIVDDSDAFGFALENQTRPIYAPGFFSDRISGDFVVVHENAHQWYGDDVSVAQWKDIWLNEGFATYAEWLWSEEQGFGSAQDNFDFFYDVIAPDDPFWQVVVADPGVDLLFEGPSYVRGAMTLQALRNEVGDDAFFRIIRGWHASRAGGTGSTPQFIAYAEQVSGQDLTPLFDSWLYTPSKPVLATASARTLATAAVAGAPAAARGEMARYVHRPG
jgi:Peptidase family M1 domain/Peptidase M1 N-terminal domain